MTDRLVIITVAYRSAAVIARMLDSVPLATSSPTELIVVDNSATDDGLAAVLEGREGVRLLRAPDNPGYGAAVNRARALLTSDVDWLVVANPDVTIAPGAIDDLVAAGRRLPRAGALGPLIRDEAGVPYPSARNLPSLRTGIGHSLFVRLWPGNPWSARYRNDRSIVERSTGWLSGAFLLLSREAFDEVGGFDESYFMYFEDVDLGLRLQRAGWTNYYIPSAEVTHVGGASTQLSPRPMIRAHHASAYRYLARKYRAWYLWPLRVALRVGLSLRSRLARG